MQENTMQEETKKVYRNDADVIDLVNIVRNMKKKRGLYLYLILLLAIVGFAVGMLMSEFSRTNSPAVAVVKMNNPETLNIDELTSSYVLTKAIDSANLSDEISVENLRNNISVERIADEESRRLISYYAEIKVDASNVDKLSEIQINYEDYYIVTLKNGYGMNEYYLSSSKLSSLLQNVLSCYSDYCYENYSSIKLPTNQLEGIDFTTLEYSRSVSILRTAMGNLNSYCSSMANSFPYVTYSNSNNNLNFAEFSKLASTALEIQFRNFESKIYYENYVKNVDDVCALYDYYIKERTMKLNEVNSNIAAYDALIADFVNGNILVLSSSNEQDNQTIEANMNYYNTLVLKQKENYASKAEYEKQISDYEDRLNRVKTGKSNSSEDVDEMIKSMYEIYNALYDEVYGLAKETMSSSGYRNGFVTYTKSFIEHESFLSASSIKKTAIGIFAGAFIGFCFWCLYGLVEELKSNKKEVE